MNVLITYTVFLKVCGLPQSIAIVKGLQIVSSMKICFYNVGVEKLVWLAHSPELISTEHCKPTAQMLFKSPQISSKKLGEILTRRLKGLNLEHDVQKAHTGKAVVVHKLIVM